MQKIDAMKREIDALANDWDISGRCAVLYKGDLVMDSTYGFADRRNGRRLDVNDTFCMSLVYSCLTGIAVMQLCDAGKLSLDDKVSKFIPEYKYADRFTVRDLFMMRCGIPDHFFGAVMTNLERDPEHAALSREEQSVKESQIWGAGHDFDEILRLIGDLPLTIEPGSGALSFCNTNYHFAAEIVSRVSNMSLYDYMKANIFDPCGMRSVRFGCDSSTASYCTVREMEKAYVPPVPTKYSIVLDFDDITRLVRAIRERKLMSKEAWRTALKFEDCDGDLLGIGFDSMNGSLLAYSVGPFGQSIVISYDEKQDVCFFSALNEEAGMKLVDDERTSFRPLAQKEVDAAFQKLTSPKFVRINLSNLHDAMSLKLSEQQRSFVPKAGDAICRCYADRKRTPYLITDGGRAIGLIVLRADTKTNEFDVAILQIDRRFQGRGYGKYALLWGIGKLAKMGARVLEIGVVRENTVARSLYESVGFIPTEVYSGGVRLKKEMKDYD